MFEETPEQAKERMKQRALELAIATYHPDFGPPTDEAILSLAEKYYTFISS